MAAQDKEQKIILTVGTTVSSSSTIGHPSLEEALEREKMRFRYQESDKKHPPKIYLPRHRKTRDWEQRERKGRRR